MNSACGGAACCEFAFVLKEHDFGYAKTGKLVVTQLNAAGFLDGQKQAVAVLRMDENPS